MATDGFYGWVGPVTTTDCDGWQGPATTTDTPQQASCALTEDLTLPGPGPPITTPRLVYGTAWKGDRTADLVYQALKCGFRGIDSANQPLHYQERLVGDGVRRAVAEGIVTRESLYLQTKFTSVDSQDPDNLPYDPDAPLEEQVKDSVESSLENLATIPSVSSSSSPSPVSPSPYLDCMVLHAPLETYEDTMAVWRVLETYVPHQIRRLGISNASLEMVQRLLADESVRFPPSVVQSRFCREDSFITELRSLCRMRGLAFQTFWTLTANSRLVGSRLIRDVAVNTNTSRETSFYALVLGLGGTSILNGTTSEEHMRADIQGIRQIEQWANGEGKKSWEEDLHYFKRVAGDASRDVSN